MNRIACFLVLLSGFGWAGCQMHPEYLEPMFAPVLTGGEDLATPRGADPHPVVLTGADASSLLGASPADVMAFAYVDGRYQPIPVQVDERFVYDLAVVYAGMEPRDCARRAWCRDLDGHVTITGYADASTQVGADPDERMDTDDELALMAADFGAQGQGHPTGVDPSTAVEVRIEQEEGPRFAYLYVRTDPTLDPAAGRAYVRYTPEFERGDYLETYERGGRRPPWIGWPSGYPSRERLGSNPERTVLETATYSVGFADRWIMNRLHLGDGPDLLDMDMIAFMPGVCWRSPYTGSLSEGGFLVNRSGPVRAIRHVVGFNSGPLVDLQWTFYARYAESRATLRVHAIPGVMSFLDLSEEAQGLTYRNEANPGGVIVDGRADGLQGGPVTWESWSTESRAFAIRHRIEADGFQPRVEPYHLDDAAPPIDACMMDEAYYGTHGFYLRSKVPNTDPRNGEAAHLTFRRQFVFGRDPSEVVAQVEATPSVGTQPWRGRETDT